MITDKNNIIANDNILVARHRTRTMNNTLVILKWTDDKANILVRMFLSMIFLQESFFCHMRPEKKNIFEYFQENKWKSSSSPLYHSRYEDYHGYKLVDSEMKFAHAMTSILSEMTRNLADSRIIPFDVVHYADFVRASIKGLKLEGDFPSTSIGTYSILFQSIENDIVSQSIQIYYF